VDRIILERCGETPRVLKQVASFGRIHPRDAGKTTRHLWPAIQGETVQMRCETAGTIPAFRRYKWGANNPYGLTTINTGAASPRTSGL